MRTLSTTEAEQIYRIPAQTFALWCREGKFAGAHKHTGEWRIPDTAIEEFFRSNPVLQPPRSEANSSGAELPKHRIWVIILALGAILAIPAAITATLNDGFGILSALWPPTVTPLPVIPASPGETLILIAHFHITTDDDTEPHIKIRRRIEEELAQLSERNVRVAVEPTVLTSDDRAKAERLGQLYQASMVIWGEETGTQVVVHFLNLRQPGFMASEVKIVESERVQVAAVANPAPYIQFITNDLPDQISFLALFAIAQSYYVSADYPHSIKFLERA